MARLEKFSRQALPNLFYHFARSEDNKPKSRKNLNIDTSRTCLNYNLSTTPGTQLDKLKKRLCEVHCLNRSDVNVVCSWVVTKPKDVLESEEDLFFQETFNFLQDRYGKQNVISAYVHKDEITPHIHFVFTPVIWDSKKKYFKISAKEVITRNDLMTFHQDLDEHMRSVFGRNIEILNAETRDGNKSIISLKRKSAILRLEKIEKDIIIAQKDLDAKLGELHALNDNIFLDEDVKQNKNLFGKIKSVTMSLENYQTLTECYRKIAYAQVVEHNSENLKLQIKSLVEKNKQLECDNKKLLKDNKKFKDMLTKTQNIFDKNKNLYDDFHHELLKDKFNHKNLSKFSEKQKSDILDK